MNKFSSRIFRSSIARRAEEDHHSSFQQKRSFTLIELLVVIAMIAILAAMLLPALNKARETAKGISCVSKINSVITTLRNYSDEYNSWLLPPMPSTSTYWTMFLYNRKYGVFNVSNDRWQDLWKGKSPWHCPSEPEHKSSQSGYTVDGAWTDYGINSATTGFRPALGSWKKYQWMKSPSRRAWMADTRGTPVGPPTYFGVNPGHLTNYEQLKNRHLNTANFIFHDGHYEKMNILKLPIMAGKDGQNIAREQGTDASTEVPYPY